MRMSRFAGANGRYTPSCEKGVCALTGNRATSKLESEIFTLLDYVLGPGKQDVQACLLGRACRIDILFPSLGARALIVEYDGAHWHKGKEEWDWRKSQAMQDGWHPHDHNVVVRIREQPLTPLGQLDVTVPARANALLCTRMTLLHLLHTELDVFGDRYPRVQEFLRVSSQPLARDEVRCNGCWDAAEYFIPGDLLVPTLRRRQGPQKPAENVTAESRRSRRNRRSRRYHDEQRLPGL
jgi:hypothetical protein